MKVAHFSDLHLLSLDGARVLDFANKRWIGGLNLLTNRSRHYHAAIFEQMVDDINQQDIDHIICTGDITNLAFLQEFEFAQSLFSKFRLAAKDITVVPGNHDCYIAEGSQHFDRIFGDYITTDPDFSWEDDDKWPIVKVRGNTVIIGLSTSRTTPWFTAYGVLGTKQCQRLESVLARPQMQNRSRIIALHHPPAGPPSQSKIRGLHDRKLLSDTIKKFGADLVIHGHEHRNLLAFLPGPNGQVPVRGIQSGTYEAGKPRRTARYRIFDIQDTKTEQIPFLDRMWKSDQKAFAWTEETVS